MMTQKLQNLVMQIERLPAEEQDAFADAIAVELADRKWDELLARPESQRFLDKLAAQALNQDAAGLTHDSSDTW